MSKRWLLSAVGVVAVVALIATAAILVDRRNSDTAVQPTATPFADEFPDGVVIDYSDPELCPVAGDIASCFVAGFPEAGILIDDYFLQYLRVRAELGGQLAVAPKAVRIDSIERAVWNESTLTGSNSGATVHGFKIVVEAKGAYYVYQTSAGAFQFAGTEQPRRQITIVD